MFANLPVSRQSPVCCVFSNSTLLKKYIIMPNGLIAVFQSCTRRNRKCYVIDNAVYGCIYLFPDPESHTFGSSRTGVFLELKAGYGCKAALGQAEYHTNGIILRSFRQHISAACASYASDIACFSEYRHDLLQIFYADRLPFCYIFQRYELTFLAHCKVEHEPQRIAPLSRYHLRKQRTQRRSLQHMKNGTASERILSRFLYLFPVIRLLP